MRSNVILDGSFELYDAYLDVHNKILVNLARHFPYAKSVPSGSFQYQAKMLAQMGMIDKETANIIMGHMRGVAGVVKEDIEAAILEGIGPTEPKLRAAAQKGFLRSSALPDPEPEQMNAFRAYYNQSIDKMNLVNTTMLESTREVYRATVADISHKIEEIQTTLNAETASVISGVAIYNQAVKSAVDRMVETGITGYVDHAGRHWRPEVYSAMVIRTTSANAARQAVFERNEQYGNDLYQVSTHDGARPLCYPWQGKVISKSDWSREVEDFEGNKVHVYAQNETSYGEAAGLFGINCGHYPMVFIPGFSSLRGEPQDPEENAKTYEESQKQRALERKVRDEKLKYDVEKARGADPERLKYQRQKVRDASHELDQFCKDTGRARRRYREYHPVNATWPDRPEGITPPLTPPTGGWGGGPTPPAAGVVSPKVPSTPPVAPTTGYGPAVDAIPEKYKKDVTDCIENAPDTGRQAWTKTQDQMKAPVFKVDPNSGKAYFQPATGEVHFIDMDKAFGMSDYQEEYSVWFHEYGHNIDNLLGDVSIKYHDGEFGRSLYTECEKRVIEFYGQTMGQTTDAFELVAEAQSGTGGMGVGGFFRSLARQTLSTEDWRAVRDVISEYGDDLGRWRVFSADKPGMMKVITEEGERLLRKKIKDPAVKDAFLGWMKSNYTIYERSDVSDMFCEYAIDLWGKDANYPFGVGHDYDYWKDPWKDVISPHYALAKEAFAEMYSATMTYNQSCMVIQEVFPESYKLFLQMLEESVK